MADAQVSQDASQPPPRLPHGLAESWRFEGELGCPSCEYNLRSLREPRCPECGAVFRWQQLLHIRCPRCGEPQARNEQDFCKRCGIELNWQRLFDAFDPRQIDHFEYTRRTLRRALTITFATMLPARFWSRMRIELPPAVRRLRALGLAYIVFFLIGAGLLFAAERQFGGAFGTFGFALVPLVPPLITAVALPMFVLTLAHFRVRSDQLLRIAAYSAAGLGWLGVAYAVVAIYTLVLLLCSVAWLSPFVRPLPSVHPDFPAYLEMLVFSGVPWRIAQGNAADLWFNIAFGTLVLLIGVAWWWRMLWCSLRRYLRIDRVNTLFLMLSTQSIGLLTLIIALGQSPTYVRLIARVLLRYGLW